MLVLNYLTSRNLSEHLLDSSLILLRIGFLEFRTGYDLVLNSQGTRFIAPTALCNGLMQHKLLLVNSVQVGTC